MYLFIHIPKTAGTTFSSLLRRNFKDKYIRIYGLKKIGFFSDAEMKSLATFFPTVKCISAHKFTCPIPQPDKESGSDGVYKLITFLREPVDRVVSNYLFVKKRAKKGVKPQFTEMSFRDYFEWEKRKSFGDSGSKWEYLGNMQAYILGRDYNLEETKRRMRENFFFIGVSERFEESLLILRKKFKKEGINFKINYFKKNVAGGRKKAKEFLSSADYNLVAENNKLDKEVHNYANFLLDEEIKKYGLDFKADLKRFRRKLKIMSLVAGPLGFLGKVVRRLREIDNRLFVWPLGID